MDGRALVAGAIGVVGLAGLTRRGATTSLTPVDAARLAVNKAYKRLLGRDFGDLEQAVVDPSDPESAAHEWAPGAEVVVYTEYGLPNLNHPDDWSWWTEVEAELVALGFPLYHESINTAVFAFYWKPEVGSAARRGGRFRGTTKGMAELLRWAESQGCRVERLSRRWRIHVPNAGFVIAPLTPSDHRSVLNARSLLRRKLAEGAARADGSASRLDRDHGTHRGAYGQVNPETGRWQAFPDGPKVVPFSWEDARDLFARRRPRSRSDKRLPGQQTWLEEVQETSLEQPSYVVWYYSTPVVTIRPNGTWVLRTGGYGTVTTLDRINAYSPANVRHVYKRTGRFGGREDEWILIESPGAAPEDPHLRSRRKVSGGWTTSTEGWEELQDGMIVNASGKLLNPQNLGMGTLLGSRPKTPLEPLDSSMVWRRRWR